MGAADDPVGCPEARVIFVNGDNTQYQELNRRLQASGRYELQLVSDPVRGLDLVLLGATDVVLIGDTANGSGLEFLRDAVGLNENVGFIVVLDSPDAARAAAALEVGAADCLSLEGLTCPVLTQAIGYAVRQTAILALLRRRERRLRALIEHSGDVTMVVNRLGVVEFVSDSIRAVCGGVPSATVGTHVFTHVHPGDVAKLQQSLGDCVAAAGSRWPIEFRCRHADGAWRYFEGLLVNRLDDAAVRGVVCHFRDVSGRHHALRAESDIRDNLRRTAFALEAAQIGTWELDLVTGQLSWSGVMPVVFGLRPDDLPTSKDAFLAMVEAEDRPAIAGAIADAVATHGTFDVEFRLRAANGVLRWYRGTGRVLGESRKPMRLIGVASDITSRKELTEQLRHAQKLEAVGRLAGGIAHDFNNLLTAIVGYGDLVVRQLGPSHSQASRVARILDAGRSAESLTRQLLAFSRRQVLQAQVIDLNQVVKRMSALIGRLIGEDVQLQTSLARSLARVKADPGQLEQVVMNLAVNARDAMPGGGRLTIETADVELDDAFARRHHGASVGPHVMLVVSDTGIGMDGEVMARLFEPFFTTKERGKGTGLGLATIYGIVKQSGGSIWVESGVGRGSTFRVYLPATMELPEEAATVAERPSAGGGETVLVVEDQSEVRAVTSEMLRNYGFRVLEAATGTEAIRFAETHDGGIHVLLTDVVMPEISGRSLAGMIEALRPGIRVVYMSGYTDDVIGRHGVLEPGLMFLQKPFASRELIDKLRTALDGELLEAGA